MHSHSKKITIRITAVLLTLLTVLPSLCGFPASAAGTTSRLQSSGVNPGPKLGAGNGDTFVLAVQTGAVAGKTILYFSIRYRDAENQLRTEFVFPHADTQNGNYDIIADNIGKAVRAETAFGKFGYHPKEKYGRSDFLETNSLDMFLVKLRFGFTSVESIDVFMYHDGGKVKNEWTCGDIRFYRADKVYGLGTTGYYSTDYYIDFSGELLAKFNPLQSNGGDFSIDKSDKLYRIEPSATKYFNLKTEFSDKERLYDSRGIADQYIFRMDIADKYGSGIESLCNQLDGNSATLFDLCIPEVLTLSVKYRDIYGVTRQTNLPFITSVILNAIDANPKVASATLFGIAQQGDTLAFAGYLPQCEEIIGYTVIYGAGAADAAGLTEHTETRRIKRITDMKNNLDYLEYVGFSIFRSSDATLAYSLDNAVLRISTTGEPILYYTASSPSGQRLSEGTTRDIYPTFKKNNPSEKKGVALTPVANSLNYIFRIETDTLEIASTNARITVGISYVDINGDSKTLDDFLLKDKVNEFVGNWPGSSDNAAYYSGLSSGKAVCFALPLVDVDYFTSVTLSIDPDSGDDWQITELMIYRVKSLEPRQIKALGARRNVNGCTVNFDITRGFSTDKPLQKYSKRTLLSSDFPKLVIKFDGSGDSDVEEKEIDWKNLSQRMTYDETRQDLGFTDGRYSYQITVKVASNSDSSSDIYGDCGSVNNFYFKLIFDNGTSGYILANQQLTGDGFRAGHSETFVIITNRSYGDLKTVRIIPDDTQENSQISDKLCVESIEVVQKSKGDVSRSWRIDNVGWISIGYQDSDSAYTLDGQRMRSELELASTNSVTSKGYSMNFMVALATDDYDRTMPEWEGCLAMTVEYQNTSGVYETRNFDVCACIAEFAGKTSVDSTSVNPALGVNYKQIDHSYMLRGGHTDRFLITLSDVTSISSITFHAYSKYDTFWNISSVYVYRVLKDGSIFINESNEYQRDNKVDFLCCNSSTSALSYLISGNPATGTATAEDIPLEMTANKFEFNDDTWESTIERIPTTDTDSVNVFFRLSDNAKIPEINDVAASIKYSIGETDKPYQSKIPNLTLDSKNRIIYAKGVSLKGFSGFNQLSIKAKTDIDSAIVQHMREGVIIATYYVPFGGNSAEDTISAYKAPRPDAVSERQVIKLQIGDIADDIYLAADEKDAAVSIKYTTTFDPTGTVISSENVFLTDRQISKLSAGDIVEISLSNSYINEIKRISVAGIGDIFAAVDCTSIACYKKMNDGAEKLVTFAGVTEPVRINKSVNTYPCKNDALIAELSLTIGTDAEKAYIGMESNKISMNVNYTDDFGNVRTLEIADISDYISSGAVKGGEDVTIKFMLPDVASLNYAFIMPHSSGDSGGAQWPVTVAKINCIIAGSESSLTRTLNTVIKEGEGYYINFRAVKAETSLTVYDEKNEFVINRTVSDKEIEIGVKTGYTLRFLTSVFNTLGDTGCKYAVSKLEGEGSYTFDKEGDEYVFVPAGPCKVRVTATVTDNGTDSVASFVITVTDPD